MGRAIYTPSTVSYLLEQSQRDEPTQYELRVGEAIQDEVKRSNQQATSQPSLLASTRKDVPWTWRQSSFDPDDANLPTVNEVCTSVLCIVKLSQRSAELDRNLSAFLQRFVGPGDTIVLQTGLSNEDTESEASDDEEHVDALTLQSEDDNDISIYEAEQNSDDVFPTHSDDLEERPNIDPHDVWDMFPPRASMYPFLHRHHDQQDIRADELSPSVGVFHTHTLPFTLPAPGEMQRRPSASPLVTASSGTF